uniref:Uncharacterized protein n=1 Tax=Knipowitschia caucasica TaxID=637954 RepID=A0AAV2JLV8_KNICA
MARVMEVGGACLMFVSRRALAFAEVEAKYESEKMKHPGLSSVPAHDRVADLHMERGVKSTHAVCSSPSTS